MSKATITLEGTSRAVLRDALLDELAAQAQRLDRALSASSRISEPGPGRKACRRIRRLSRLIDQVGWDGEPAGSEIAIDLERQMPGVIAALRSALRCAEDHAKDACLHGGGGEMLRASIRLQETWEAMLDLEVQAARRQCRERR